MSEERKVSERPVRLALMSRIEAGLVMLGEDEVEADAQIRFGVVHEGRFGYVRKEWNRNPRYTGPDLLWYRA